MGHENFHLQVLFGVFKFLRTGRFMLVTALTMSHMAGISSACYVTQIQWHEGHNVDVGHCYRTALFGKWGDRSQNLRYCNARMTHEMAFASKMPNPLSKISLILM